jgi:hypothetical protein
MKSNSILFIPSYPRSGNTFTRILLCTYMAAGNESFDLDRLEEAIPADTSEFLWQGVPDYDAQEVSARNNRRYRRQVIADYRRRETGIPLRGLKTHTANLTAFGEPAFDFDPDDRIIHLVRNPLDVVLSNADFNDQDIERSIDLMCNSGTCVSTGKLGGIEVRGSWCENVESWLKPEICPTLLVRYEDLRHDTESVLRRMIDFIGLPVEEQRLKQAVEQSQFSRLQQREAESGFAEAPKNTTSGRFFREGRTDQWRTQLSGDQINRLTSHGGEVMQRLGYLTA